MKRIFAFVLIFLFAINAVLAQKSIRMEKEGGIYKISCKVNGAPMKMYFDTGASTVSISRATAIYLLENDLISVQDFRGKTKTATADGTISDNMVINIKDIEIAGMHLRDVKATVSYSLNAPLLLGQTAIQRLGKISLNGNILTIHTNTPATTLQNKEREELDLKLRHLRDTRKANPNSSYEILEITEKIEVSSQLNEFELFCKVMSLQNVLKWDDAISAAQIWIDRYAANTDSIDWKMRVFLCTAYANFFSKSGDKDKGMEYFRRCQNYWESSDDGLYWVQKPLALYEYCKYENDGYSMAIYAAKESIKKLLKINHVSLSDINSNKYPDWDYNICFYSLLWNHQEHTKWQFDRGYQFNDQDVKYYQLLYILAAKVGVPGSADYCRMNNIDYKRVLTTSELEMTGLLVY